MVVHDSSHSARKAICLTHFSGVGAFPPLSSSSEQAEKETAANIAATIRNNFFINALSVINDCFMKNKLSMDYKY